MRSRPLSVLALCMGSALACRAGVNAPAPAQSSATLAQIFYWRAKPGKLDDYNRYITQVAEPIDADAQKHGAFISVTTFMTSDTLSPWTHMRMFLLRDSVQLAGLGAALDAAGARLQPDSVKRRQRN